MSTMNIKGILLDNRYRIVDKIGVGGMADVYLGEDTLLGRQVAIKVLHANFANDDEFVTRFKREAQAAGKLNHPNIVNMYDVGFNQDLHYIIMEYVDGETLKEYITRHGRLSIDEAVKFTIAIAEGLEHAHTMGIVHCDIKPHNVIITRTGRVKVTDFGIARAMNATNTVMYTNSILGSAHYLSPEQASGKPVDGNTDIYSLGVVLYEMLTMGKTQRHEPYDFATQMIPAVDPEALEDFSDIQEEQKDEGKKKSMLSKIASIPQKYIVLGAAVIFLVAFLGAFLSYGNFWSNTTVDVPNVVGKQVSVAKNILEDKHLRVSTSEVTNPDVPAGQVISQTPGAGEKVKEQRTIHLVVSKGVGDITVPDLSGLTVDQARQRLKDVGLVVGKVTQQSVDNKPDGVIIAQSPSGDSKVSKGTTIDLVVNKAKAKKIQMPNVIGMTLKDARDTLSNAHLGVNQVAGSVEEKSIVTEQSIKAGDEIDEGTAVNLTTEYKDDKKKNDKKSDSSSNKTTGTVDITVPAGSKNQELKIVVKDDDGSAVIYDDTNKPGDRIVKKVSGVGNVRIEVYLNGALVQETAL